MNDEKPQFQYTLSEDKSSITLSFGDTKHTFTAQEFENFIGYLGVARSEMSPSVPHSTTDNMPGIPLDGLYLQHSRSGNIPTKDGAVIAARSAFFGWFLFPIDPQFCQGIISWLSSKPEEISTPIGATLN